MPRPRKAAPAYQFHVSGQGFVNLGGTRFYLGKHGSSDSYARYHALLAEYNANGKRIPVVTPTHQIDDEMLVKHVTADYRARELPKVEHNVGDHGWQSNMLDLLESKYGGIAADDFGVPASNSPMKCCRAIGQLASNTGQSHFAGYARISVSTWPCTSVRRRSMPSWRTVSWV